jgi:pyridoxal phosphate enzyme (YggS family)
VAVTKGLPVATVEAAAAVGLQDLGENYVQDLMEKRAAAPQATWHFVGRMQRNKVPGVVDHAHVIHTLEPGRAVERLARLIARAEERPRCLVEIDFTGGRVGVPPDEAERFVLRLRDELYITVDGLMTVAPLGRDPRQTFIGLRELIDRIGRRIEEVRELSMGMSTDLEAAVEEGATMVRVGTAIFGPRPER